MSPGSPVVTAENLVKRFEYLTAVDGISFEVSEGEIFGLLGPNGAGKTTTVRMICGIFSPDEGRATVMGMDSRTDPIEVKSRIGLLPETPSVYESLTADENLQFFAEMHRVPENEGKERIERLLANFGLEGRRDSKVETFSKGMKQKLALARTLIHEPPVIFLDEPTSGLDPESAKMVRDTIAQMSQEEKTTIFLCTHNLMEAEMLCSRLAIIRSGKIIRLGSPGELRSDQPKTGRYRVQLESIPDSLVERVGELEFVLDLRPEGTTLNAEIADPDSNAPDLVREIVGEGGRVRQFVRDTKTLEDIYLEAVRG